MNSQLSWEVTGDLLEAVDPKLHDPIFSYTHSYTQSVINSYSIQDFDFDVLLQGERKGGVRTVSQDVIFKGVDIAGSIAIPLIDIQRGKSITGYQLLDRQKKPITIIGEGLPIINFNIKAPQCFIATDNVKLLLRLSNLNHVAMFFHDIYKAFELVDGFMDDSKPRLIATNNDLANDIGLSAYKVHFDSDVSNYTDVEIKKKLNEKANNIQPVEIKLKSSLNIICMDDIQAQPITWLWDRWLPSGKMTILAGAGGCGKTNISLALIAIITTGGVFPDGSKCSNKGKVLIYSTEDDPADTLKPRLIANGADMSKVFIIESRSNDKGELEPFDPSQDFPKIAEYIQANPDVKLLMIDPIISAVSGDMNKANDVRRSLQPLVDLANEYKFSILGITHFSKGSAGSSPADRVIGSQAFTALARMAWSAAKREDDSDCILVRAKSNNSTLEGGIRYQIESETVLDHIETTKTVWLGVIDGTARELLGDAESSENNNSTVDNAKEFLIDLLSPVEKMPASEVQVEAKNAGFSMASIRRAKDSLSIKPFKDGAAWYWRLPLSFREVPQVLPEHKQRY